MLQQIEVDVFGQVIEPRRKVNLASDLVNQVGLLFNFDELWQEFEYVHAFFRNCGSGYEAPPVLVEDNKVLVPWEVLTTTGKIDVSLVGNKVDEKGFITERLTTYKATVYIVRENERVTNKLGPTGGEFEYLINLLNKKKDKFPYDFLKRRTDFLYDVHYSELDYDYAKEYMRNNFKDVNPSGCSAVFSNGLLGKNLDWYYDWTVQFAVMIKPSLGRYASIGVAGGIKSLTVESVKNGENIESYKIVPFLINEGVNECGVFACANVVPNYETKDGVRFTTKTTGTNEGKSELCAAMLCRVVLDRFSNATDAVNALRDEYNIYCPNAESLDEELHFLIGDQEKQYVVEFINNEVIIIDVTDDKSWITNYYRATAEFDENNHLIWQSLTDHAMGVHRSNLIADNVTNDISIKEMMSLISETLKYSNTYTENWIDELCGDYETFGNLTIEDVYTNPEKFDDILAYVKNQFEHRSRDYDSPYFGSWETCHSVVYDIVNRRMYVIVREEGMLKAFYYSYDKDSAVFVGFDKANKYLMADENGMVIYAETVDADTLGGHSADFFASKDDLYDYATKEWVNEQGFIKEHQSLEEYRKAADQDLIDEELQANIDNEATLRQEADSALQGNIDSEALQRANDVSNLENSIDTEANARYEADQNILEKFNSYRTAEDQDVIDNALEENKANKEDVEAIDDRVEDIEGKIPTQATPTNQLADKDFVNSSLNSITAFYITKNAQGDGFESYEELMNATVFYSGGEVRIPTRNDYCIVRVDETQDDATTRYIFQNNQWEFQYLVNETPLTSDQLKAINSGITAELVELIGSAVQPSALTEYRKAADQDIIDGGKVNKEDSATSISNNPSNDKWVTESALYNYIASGNGGKPRLLDNVDLNTVSATGFYSCNVCTNRPTDHNGVMLVIKNAMASDNVVQVYWTFTADVMWVRHKDLGNWKAWQRIYNKGDVDTLFDGKISGVKLAGTELTPDENGKVDVPIASPDVLGVMYVNNTYGCIIHNKMLKAVAYSPSNLAPKSENTFISKGTYEQCKEDYVKRALESDTFEDTEDWVFTLDDGTTVTKKVVVV